MTVLGPCLYLYSPSEGSNDVEDSPSTSPSRTNIINAYWNEEKESEGELSASIHDDSSYISSDDDDLMPDLFDSSDESEEKNDTDSDSELDEEFPWTEVDLIQHQTGKFKSQPPLFPKYTPRNKPGPIYLHPATAFPIDFFHLCLDVSIM